MMSRVGYVMKMRVRFFPSSPLWKKLRSVRNGCNFKRTRQHGESATMIQVEVRNQNQIHIIIFDSI